jgi:hypothetical protein
VPTNLNLLRALAQREDFLTQDVHTRLFESILPALMASAETIAEAERAQDARFGGASHATPAHASHATRAPRPKRNWRKGSWRSARR